MPHPTHDADQASAAQPKIPSLSALQQAMHESEIAAQEAQDDALKIACYQFAKTVIKTDGVGALLWLLDKFEDNKKFQLTNSNYKSMGLGNLVFTDDELALINQNHQQIKKIHSRAIAPSYPRKITTTQTVHASIASADNTYVAYKANQDRAGTYSVTPPSSYTPEQHQHLLSTAIRFTAAAILMHPSLGYSSGATETTAYNLGKHWWFSQLGDSRALLCYQRLAADGKNLEWIVTRATCDYSVDRPRARAKVIADGGKNAVKFGYDCDRVQGITIPTSVHGDKHVDMVGPGLSHNPAISYLQLSQEDLASFVIISSDGGLVDGMLSEKNIAALLNRRENPIKHADLAGELTKIAMENGSEDDIIFLVSQLQRHISGVVPRQGCFYKVCDGHGESANVAEFAVDNMQKFYQWALLWAEQPELTESKKHDLNQIITNVQQLLEQIADLYPGDNDLAIKAACLLYAQPKPEFDYAYQFTLFTKQLAEFINQEAIPKLAATDADPARTLAFCNLLDYLDLDQLDQGNDNFEHRLFQRLTNTLLENTAYLAQSYRAEKNINLEIQEYRKPKGDDYAKARFAVRLFEQPMSPAKRQASQDGAANANNRQSRAFEWDEAALAALDHQNSVRV